MPAATRSPSRPNRAGRFTIETLERRLQLSGTSSLVNQLTFHINDANTGADIAETTLSPANVKVGSFGKLYTVPVDGNVYTEPLILTRNAITAGPNTTTGAAGIHDTVFVGTEHDSLYAIDSSTGAVLWQRSFLDITPARIGVVPGTNVNNPLGATSITTVASADVGTYDISPEIGITGTPVIDAAAGIIYVSAATKETIGGVINFVQRLHAISVSNGTDVVLPYQIGQTSGDNTNTTNIYVYGTGDGSVTDPYNNTAKPVVQFNALHENQRDAISLVNNTIYMEWGSHGDVDPYHGWIVALDASKLSTAGFSLEGVFCSSPNGGEAGIWQGGGQMGFEPDGSAFYFVTGNGSPGHGPITVNPATGLPADGSYYDAVGKGQLDPTTTPSNQNQNGWGIKIVDFFAPYNQDALDNADADFGSGGPIVLPASAGIPGHPNLLLACGKQGVVYLVDRNNLGGFDPANDHVVNAVPNGSGQNTPPVNLAGSLSTPVFFNGTIYWVPGYSGAMRSFVINTAGTLVTTSQTVTGSFGYEPGSPVVSADGTTGGIVWQTDRSTNQLHAYDATSLGTELWNSGQKAAGADAVGSVMKLSAPTVANGQVYVDTTDSLVVYGLTPPATAVPVAPTLTATVLSGTSINLTWTDPTTNPNTATDYSVEQLIGGTWTAITTAPGGSTALALGGLSLTTAYSFRIRGLNGLGYSAYSNITTATTTNQVSAIDFGNGFGGSVAGLTFNGTATVVNGQAQLTTLVENQAGSIFSTQPVDVSKFTTTFLFQQTAGNATADGMTFTIQDESPTALGSSGGGLGYAEDGTNGGPIITDSAAVKFDLWSNQGEGSDSTGLYLNGASPTVPSIDLSQTGINLHSGDVMQAVLTYDGTDLTETLTDTVTGAIWNNVYAVNLNSFSGGAAYVGFTGGTGGLSANQDIVSWKFSPNAVSAPAAPTGLGAAVTSGTSINLTWTNNATNQTGFLIDRATDANFLNNLVTQTLPAGPSTFADTLTGLASGGIYYYRLRATNTAGSSAVSNVASIAIPYAPAKPTNAAVTSVTATAIGLSWTDNAGISADGYRILRAVNGGPFTAYATLPSLNAKPPTEYDWADTDVTPGSFYDYHIQAYNVAGYNDFTGINAYALPLPPANLTAAASGQTVTLNWTPAAGAVSYNVYRGMASGNESATPIATGVTAETYVDTAPIAGATDDYYVTAVNGNIAPVASESGPSPEASAAVLATAAKLTGVLIGTTSYWSSAGVNTNAVDDNFSTYFDPSNGNLTNWVGLDLGAPAIITQIEYAPRAGYEYRMAGGIFQASSSATFSTKVVNLYTIATTPIAGKFTVVSVNSVTGYQYVRYTGGTQWVNIAEMELDGTTVPATPRQLTGVPIGTQQTWDPDRTVNQVFDGDPATFFDPANGNLTNWVGLDLGTPATVTQINYIPRAGYEFRMVGGMFQVSSTPDFAADVHTLYTITDAPPTGVYTSALFTPVGAYRYVRYTGGNQWVNIAEMQVVGLQTAATPVQFTGTPIGTSATWTPTSGVANVFDGNLTTFFDPADGNLSDWAGLDLGTAQTITEVKFAPRPGYEYRMFGGQIQVSSTPDFSLNVATLYTIATSPTAGVMTTVIVEPAGSFRYVRYTGGSQWVNIAELQVFG